MEFPESIVGRATTDFIYYLQNDCDLSSEGYLDDWLDCWLALADGVPATAQRFETFQRVALNVADAAIQGVVSFDYMGTQEENYEDKFPRTLLGLNNGGYVRYLDRANYEFCVQQWKAAREGKPIDIYPVTDFVLQRQLAQESRRFPDGTTSE